MGYRGRDVGVVCLSLRIPKTLKTVVFAFFSTSLWMSFNYAALVKGICAFWAASVSIFQSRADLLKFVSF